MLKASQDNSIVIKIVLLLARRFKGLTLIVDMDYVRPFQGDKKRIKKVPIARDFFKQTNKKLKAVIVFCDYFSGNLLT